MGIGVGVCKATTTTVKLSFISDCNGGLINATGQYSSQRRCVLFLKKKGRGSKRRAWWHAPLISAFVLQRLVDLSGVQGEFQGFTVRTYPTPMPIALGTYSEV